MEKNQRAEDSSSKARGRKEKRAETGSERVCQVGQWGQVLLAVVEKLVIDVLCCGCARVCDVLCWVAECTVLINRCYYAGGAMCAVDCCYC